MTQKPMNKLNGNGKDEGQKRAEEEIKQINAEEIGN